MLVILVSCKQKETKPISKKELVKNDSPIAAVSPRKQLQLQQNTKLKYDSGNEQQRVYTEMQKVKAYVSNKALGKNYAVVINMRIPSYKKRLFVYDLATNAIVSSALVSHGQGSVVGADSLRFSNIPESKQSSIGKYRVGISYYGQWGFAYRLHGLDATNNKALERNIVLHSYKDVPDEETDSHIVLSSGCPMVSPKYLQKLKTYIDNAGGPMIISIIY